MKEIEPSLKDKSDDEIEEIRRLLYQLGEIAFESYINSKKREL